ncbi:MAG: hypothetical protein FWD68_07820 [Alphaproteobacteria bacterium]|nr:hypothetical protein [Alphaproteobacteria bacterium]
MRRRTIANKMGVSHQRVHQLIVQLHASGHVCYADPTRPWWMVMTAQDTTPFLSHDTERVLSVLPQGYGTDVKKISVALQMPTQDVEASIHTLLDQALAREDCVAEGPAIYSLTPAGETHPQRVPHRAPAKAAHLTVGSERVRTVLAIIQESGALRIRDATERLGMPHQSLNALFQYLKRKRLIAKTDDGFFAPYSLTNNGHTTLTEMNRRNS